MEGSRAAGREELEMMWREMNRDKDSVEAAVKRCIGLKQEAKVVLQTWLEAFLAANEDKQRTLLYVIWELFRQLAQSDDTSGLGLVEEFWKHLPVFLPTVRSQQLLGLLREFTAESEHIGVLIHHQDLEIINSHSLTQQLYSIHLPRGQISKGFSEWNEEQFRHDCKSEAGRKGKRDAELFFRQYMDCEMRRLEEMTRLIMILSREMEAQLGRLES